MKSAMSIQCLPSGAADKAALYRMVDAAIDAVDRSGLPYTVGPFETTVEGELDALIEVLKAAHAAMLAAAPGGGITLVKLASAPDLDPSEAKVAKYRVRGH